MTGRIESGPEALKGEDWAGEMGAKWRASVARFEAMIAPVAEALLKKASRKPGQCIGLRHITEM
ncbi:MAG: hypothetical protein U5J78_02870 [Parasphingorhabdus sp.]|nr:hypothetical protein [Parasphingorhabdus sp.]